VAEHARAAVRDWEKRALGAPLSETALMQAVIVDPDR